MFGKSRKKKSGHVEMHFGGASYLGNFILGWQDGLVNVLGIILGVAVATNDFKILLIAALAATFAESVSMAAVAYTSSKAETDFYWSEVRREKKEMKDVPEVERAEVRQIYRRIGFTGRMLDKIVRHITSNKKRWLDVMMVQELKLSPPRISPVKMAAIVGLSAIVGSVIPIIPFLFMPISQALWGSLILATAVLFCVGIYKAKRTVGSPIKSGIELAIIGMMAALVGYAIGAVLGATVV